MKRISLVIALLLLAVSAGAAHARDHKYADAKVAFWYPDKWEATTEDGALVVNEPAGEVSLVFSVIAAKDLETALGKLDGEIARWVKDLKASGDPEEVEINGMKAVAIDGKGKAEGQPVDVSIAVIATPSGKALVIVGLAQSKKLKKHEKTVTKILASIKPAK